MSAKTEDTDVAGEMASLKTDFRDCAICLKACTAAVDMLAVSPLVDLFLLNNP